MAELYAIVTRDKDGASETRRAQLEAHLAHIERELEHFAVAGPLYDDAGHFAGSLLIVKASSEAEARALLEADPYYQAGIWSHIEIQAFSAAAGDWVGGKNW